jgi:hypothetical protein
MGATDQDGAWLVDCTAWAAARGVTLVSVGAPEVQRKDGKVLEAGDIAVSGTAVVAIITTRNEVTVQPNFGFVFSVTANGNATRYLLGFPITDSAGDVVVRWGELPVVAKQG